MTAFCGACKLTIEKSDSEIKCSGVCDRVFHSNCVKEDFETKKTRSAWKCKDCKAQASSQGSVKSSSSSSTPITKEFLLRVFEDFKNEVFGELKSFQKEVGELTLSMQFLSDKVDSASVLINEVRAEFATLKKENQELRAATETMSTEVEELRDRVRTLEQYTRRNNVEISGVPVTPGEKVQEIIKDLGEYLEVATSELDIAAAHRIPTFKKDSIPSIVVQFQHRATRDMWISSYRQKKMMTAKDINRAYPASRVFVNEHLSPDNKIFLARLKKKCRDIGYKYAWVRDGKFFARKSEGVKCQKVSSFNDIEKLK